MKTNLLKPSVLLLSALCMMLALVSCGGNGSKGGSKKSLFTPTSSGRAYEILVVVDQDLWERPAGRALYAVLDTDVPGLPQSERSFRIMYTAPAHYDSTLKLIRNIIIVDINPNKYTQPKFSQAKDVYAAPQAILTIQAPDEDSFETFVTERSADIVSYFTRMEMNRQMMMLEDSHSDRINSATRRIFGCEAWLPGELSSTKERTYFFWAGTNAATADRNFVMYSFPYRDKETFTQAYLIHKRDSVMRANIPGARKGSYMKTDSLMTDGRAISVQGEYAFELRGLWRMHADMMGGPFVAHARLDELNQRVVVSEVFVYSPDKMKRNLIRTLEASLYTVRMPANLLPDDSDK